MLACVSCNQIEDNRCSSEASRMITVEIAPSNPDNNEYKAAKTLKAIFERDIESSMFSSFVFHQICL